MKDSDRYAKVVVWSDEDQCFIGTCPGLVIGGCHGHDPQEVFRELCEIADEVVAILHEDGKPLPPVTDCIDVRRLLGVDDAA